MKKILVLAVTLLAGGGAYFYFQRNGREGADPPAAYGLAKAEIKPLTVTVAATGVVEPRLTVEVKSKASGQILRIPFGEGQSVVSSKSKKDLLVEIDPADERRDVKRAQAALDIAKANLAQAEIARDKEKKDHAVQLQNAKNQFESASVERTTAKNRLDRGNELFNRKLISPEERDALENLFHQAVGHVQQAEANLHLTENAASEYRTKEEIVKWRAGELKRAEVEREEAAERLADTTVYAPISGVILKRNVEVGQIITSSITHVSGGSPLMTVADLSKVFVDAKVDEADIGRVKEGQDVRITADAFSSETFRGRVVWIAPQGQEENNVVVFRVLVLVASPNRTLLKPAMTANVEVVVDQRNEVLQIPNAALKVREKEFGVFLMKDGRPTFVAIAKGGTNGMATEIVSGLRPGDDVIVSGLAPGAVEALTDSQRKMTRSMWMLRSGKK